MTPSWGERVNRSLSRGHKKNSLWSAIGGFGFKMDTGIHPEVLQLCKSRSQREPRTFRDVWQERWEVQSMTDASKTYICARKQDGSFGCSCPAWKFHKAPKPHCKHLISLLETLVSVATRSRIFLDGEFTVAKYMNVGTAFPSKSVVDRIMGRSNAAMIATVNGEQFKVRRVFLEE